MRILFVLLAITSNVSAAIDAEMKSPYALTVVLKVGDHPHFTEHFRRQLPRELRDHLQAALGPLGTVEVVDRDQVKKEDWPALWKLAEEKGLAGLDTFRDAVGGKTHFLNLDYVDGQYVLTARQHDGSAGFVTPIVRRMTTPDRAQVERLASLLIAKDFGFIATLEPGAQGDNYFLKAKAGGLGPIDKWVKKGEVFAVVAERNERRRPAADPLSKTPVKTQTIPVGNRVDGVLLQVTGEPRHGLIPCRMFHRYEEPLPRGTLGFRAVKLGTVVTPLRLRLVDQAGQSQKAAALQVHARGTEFPDGDREADQAPARDGIHTSAKPFEHVAFVRVMLGNRRLARIPVELLDDRIETRLVRLDPAAELRDRLDAERRSLVTRLTDGRLIQVRVFQEITALEQEGKKQEALDRGRVVQKLLEAAGIELQDEIDKLETRAQKELPKGEGFARDCGRQLQLLKSKHGELKQHLDELVAAIADDNNPAIVEKKRKVQDLIRAAELLVTQAEYEKALAAYQQAIAAAADEPAAKAKIETAYANLKRSWEVAPGDAGHATARKFIIETWPKLGTPRDVTDALPRARQAFEKCKSVGDKLALMKMLLSSAEVVSRFGDELKRLTDAATTEEEGKALEAYRKSSEDLQTLLRDVQQFLQGK